jgi:DNA-binding transcriptional MerR regulator
MIRIGDFARIGQVSIVTLRHYDEIGLLKPIAVDSFTSYRYYSVSQLPHLNRILALKDLGFSLDQIKHVLNGLTVEQLRGMLKLKQAAFQQHIADEQARLVRIEARLSQIETEDMMPAYDVVLKVVPAMVIASRTVTIPTNDHVPVYLDTALFEADNYATTHGARAIGDWFAIWHQPAEIHANEVAEAAVPIDQAVPSSDQVKVYTLPQTQVAALIHHGAFENLVQEHTALLRWIDANGYATAGPYREIYIRHDRNTMANSATEIQYPVEKQS